MIGICCTIIVASKAQSLSRSSALSIAFIFLSASNFTVHSQFGRPFSMVRTPVTRKLSSYLRANHGTIVLNLLLQLDHGPCHFGAPAEQGSPEGRACASALGAGRISNERIKREVWRPTRMESLLADAMGPRLLAPEIEIPLKFPRNWNMTARNDHDLLQPQGG